MAAVATILGAAVPAVAVADQRQDLLYLRSADLRLARVANRLVIANAQLCDRLMPEIGATIHALDQYPVLIRAEATRYLGFESPIAVEAIVPGAAADIAGLRPGDGLLAINELPLPVETTAMRASSATRDAVERAIVGLPPDRPIAFRFRRLGQIGIAIVHPSAACRTRYEVLSASRLIARSDGETIQISSSFLDRFTDDALAVAFAHELAHTILGHRAKIEAARMHKGSTAGFGTTRRTRRFAEREADRLSVHLLANADFDPAIAPRFWRENGSKLSLFGLGDMTHDSAKARSDALIAEIALIEHR